MPLQTPSKPDDPLAKLTHRVLELGHVLESDADLAALRLAAEATACRRGGVHTFRFGKCSKCGKGEGAEAAELRASASATSFALAASASAPVLPTVPMTPWRPAGTLGAFKLDGGFNLERASTVRSPFSGKVLATSASESRPLSAKPLTASERSPSPPRARPRTAAASAPNLVEVPSDPLQGALMEPPPPPSFSQRNAEFFHARGVSAIARGDVPGALSDYSRAIGMGGALLRSHLSRALAYDRVGEHTRAVGDYTRALGVIESRAAAEGRLRRRRRRGTAARARGGRGDDSLRSRLEPPPPRTLRRGGRRL